MDERSNALRAYVWGDGVDRLLAVKIGGRTYTALTDVQGTVWGYADESGAIAALWTYDAWGNVLSEEVAPSAEALRSVRNSFQGRERSAATGLVNFRMRWCDPTTGRWLSKDPIGLNGGLNLYMFCDVSPLSFIDPYGCARIGNRRLHGAGALLMPLGIIPGMVIPMRLTNTSPEHRHIFFDDGSNIGWGQDGFTCSETEDGYTFKRKRYDDTLLKQAVERVNPKWRQKAYNGLFHNCQDFVDAVLEEYEKLVE